VNLHIEATRSDSSPGKKEIAIATLALFAVAAVLVLWGRSARWDTGESLGVAGIAISIAGFSMAIWQIQRTQGAADAAFSAIHETLKGVAASRLGVVIVQMRWAIQEYEQAIAEIPDFDRAKLALTRWREHGGDAETLIERRFGGNADCLPPLKDSREFARVTKSRMFGSGEEEPDLRKCLEQMEHAADALGPLLEQLWPVAEENT
jgi:hypothetical protein